jgi:hypothetical protein
MSEQHMEVAEIQPFWLRMPRFFLYPLHLEPLLYMIFLSCATLLALIVPLPLILGFLLVFLGILLAFIRYAYKTLDRTAMGFLAPDQYVNYDDSGRAGLPYKQFGIFFVIGALLGLAERAGGLVFGAALMYGLLSMPAATMILTVTRSFWSALNPFAVIRMMTTIGMPYLGLCAFLFLLSASQGVLQSFLAPRVPQWMALPTLAFVAMYFTLIMFNMMGYVLYQYHHLLGVRVRNDRLGGGAGAGSRAAGGGETASYADLIASGQIGEALDQAYEERRIDPENVAANDRYHKLLLLSERKERLQSHTRSYLALLLKKGLAAEAIKLYGATREKMPDFEPEEPAQLLRLAEAARQARDFTLALSLLNGFDKRFPKSEEIPAVYFFAAQTLCENFREDAKARQLLTKLLKHYPTHPVSDKARQLLNFLEKLAAQP